MDQACAAESAARSRRTTRQSRGELDDERSSPAVVAVCHPGVSGVSRSSTSVNLNTTAATTVSGVASGGFTFFNVAGSGAVLTSGIGTIPSVASVATAPATIAASANVTQVWPTIPAVLPPVAPSAGAFSATQLMIPQYSGGGFGIKLDNVRGNSFEQCGSDSSRMMNALRTESELDERSDEPSGGQYIFSAQSAKGSRGKQQDQRSDKNKKRGNGRYKSKGKTNRGGSAGNQGGKKNNGENPRECWNCHKTGHIQTNCPSPRRKDDETDSALPERKRFQNKKTSGKSDGNARHVDMLSHQDSNSEIIATQSAISNSVEWILDSASDCHVCTNKALLSNLRQDDGPLVFDWEGKPSRSRGQVGDPELRVHKIEVFGADQGPELVNTKFEAYLRERGISLITTNTYSPEENGLVERMHGIVLSRIRSLLTTVDMPELLWGEAFQFAVEMLNVSPSYAKRSISYRLLDLRTGDIKELRTVQFAEDWTVDRSYVEKLLLNRYLRGKYILPANIPYVRLDKLTSPSPTTTLGSQNDDEHRNKRHCSQDLRAHIVVDAPPATGASVLPSVPISGVLSMNPTRTAEADARPSRARGQREYVPSQIPRNIDGGGGAEGGEDLSNRSCSAPSECNGDLSNRRDSVHSSNPLALSDFDEDDMDQSWSDANDEATDAVIANGDPVEGTLRSVGVGKERDDEEDIELGASFRRSTRIRRPNVRLSDYNVDIPASCQQEFGVNFWETYAPVSKIESVRAILLLALYLGLNCRQVDFVTAFLNGPIGEADIYMEQPYYFDNGSGRVCKLRRSLYGLRQAPRIWYQVLDKYLRKCGFNRTKMDAGVYVRTAGANKVFITVYVDDLLIVGADPNIEEVVAELKKEFKIKDLGNVKNLLGMEITYVRGRMLTISQKGYCEKVLKRFKMDKCKPVPTPQVKGNLPRPGVPEVEPVCVNADPDLDYRQIVGSLQYLAQCSRPDIANAVRTLGKFMNCYTQEHHVLAKRVLRYLRGTTDYGLVWTVSDKVPDFQVAAYVDASRRSLKEVKVEAYADADLGNEKDDRRSVTGFVLQLNGCTYAYANSAWLQMTLAVPSLWQLQKRIKFYLLVTAKDVKYLSRNVV
ncbi:unnamed protein product [Phytophthora fragariaefolia]|uniref:Unnamed protein product n=1 Tax=Phytophthora fragariaefolia TaxID=1490495 RepID=A0A9W6XY22_9STRA|nr:unnamed protein product [Phytophthora fragariaefolia]